MIPNSVTSIGQSAFFLCTNLAEFVVPNSVTSIGGQAFEACTSLTTINIPENVTSIGKDAFCDCSGLRSIISEIGTPSSIDNSVFAYWDNGVKKTIPATLYVPAGTKSLYEATDGWNQFSNIVEIGSTSYSDGDTFAAVNSDGVILNYQVISTEEKTVKVTSADQATHIEIPAEVNGFNVIEIGHEFAEGDEVLESIVIPNGIQTINSEAFRKCTSLTSLYIPESVTRIKTSSFMGCTGLRSVVVASGNPVYDSRDNCNGIIETETNTLIFGNSATEIPQSVTTIGRFTGEGSVVIPSHITVIDEDAFGGMEAMTSVTIPAGVIEIGSYAFNDCIGLTSVTSLITEPFDIDESVFGRDKHLDKPLSATLYVPVGTKAKYEATAGWSVFPNIVEFTPSDEEELQSIEIDGIYYEIAEAGIVLKDIQQDVYPSDEEVAVVVANPSNEYHGDIVIPSSITYEGNTYPVVAIAEAAFSEYKEDDEAAQVITIEGNTYSDVAIAERTFAEYRDLNLNSVFIPNSVVSIGNEAFRGCTGLTSVTIPESVITIGEKTFRGCTGLTSVTISEGVTSIGKKAFKGCTGLTSVSIPESVTSIGDGAFEKSTSLQRVELHCSPTFIGEDAFGDCESLKEIVSYIESPFNLPTNVFRGVPSDATLYVPAGSKAAYEAADYWKLFQNIVEMEPAMEEETDISQMDNVIYIANAKAIADDLQTMLVVKMKNNVTAAGFHFDLYLPDGCTFTFDDKGRPNAKLSDERTDSNIKLTTPKLNSDGSLMIEAHSGNASVISGEDGAILMVPIIVAEGTEVGDNHVIYVKNWGISDELGNTLPQAVNPTVTYKLTVIPNIRGDVNGNNVKFIESSDFVALIRYLMDLPHVELNTTATDANGDGIIDIGDLTAISNLKKHGSISRPVNNTAEVKSVIFTTPTEAE